MKNFLTKGWNRSGMSGILHQGTPAVLFSKYGPSVRLPFEMDMQFEMNSLIYNLGGVDSKNKKLLQQVISRQGYDKFLRRGNDRITIDKMKLGEHRDWGHSITLHRGDQTLTNIHFGNILIRDDHWALLVNRFNKEIERYKRAVQINNKRSGPDKHPAPTDSLGDEKKRRRKKAKQAAEIEAKLSVLGRKIKHTMNKGNGPKKIIIYSDGPDAAGKSSTGAVVLEALKQADYKTRT